MLSLVSVFLFFACKSSQGTTDHAVEAPNLYGTSWQVETMGPATGKSAPVMEGTVITVNFADKSIQGKASCNSYNGACEIK